MQTIKIPSGTELRINLIESVGPITGQASYSITMSSGKEYLIKDIVLPRSKVLFIWRQTITPQQLKALVNCVEEDHKCIKPTSTVLNICPNTLQEKLPSE